MPRLITSTLASAFASLITLSAAGQSGPVNGMRPADLRHHAITNATVMTEPGRTIENATIVMKDGVITAVGSDMTPPPGARVWDGEGMMVYAGLIDAALQIEMKGPERTVASHWNTRVHPAWRIADTDGPEESLRKTMRDLGFTAAAVYPSNGAFRGTGAVLALSDEPQHLLAYDEDSAMAIALDYSGGWSDRTYPASAMGAVALIRQTLYDAQWHVNCQRVYETFPAGNEPPIRADALAALVDVVEHRQRIVTPTRDEHELLRAIAVFREFDLSPEFIGSGSEYRRLPEIAGAAYPIVLPLNFPKRPEITDPSTADQVSLRTMQHWEQAPTNPRRLIRAGIDVALTTEKLKKRTDFHARLRTAIQHGLTEAEALAALTTTPARMLGLNQTMGTIETGKVANLVVCDGSLFGKDTKIIETWINGRRYEKEPRGETHIESVVGFTLPALGIVHEATLDTRKKKLAVTIDDETTIKASNVSVMSDRLSAVIDGTVADIEGYIVLSGTITADGVDGKAVLPGGQRIALAMTVAAPADDEDADAEAGDDDAADDDFEMPADEIRYPLGAYGVAHVPAPVSVLVRNATIWTGGDNGILEDAWLYIDDGTVQGIGSGLGGPTSADVVIDADGKHITPGLIDCHSHTGITGGVNEWTQANSAEVRIGDCINPDDINWYRQLAGGLTAANQLHGSANPIGGQNSVVKLRWGQTADGFRVDDALPGIKFALGENVKRSENRYPDTRMGVESFIRDAFTAARDYESEWNRYNRLAAGARARTMPPQRDLELETLVEILNGERIIHCHSYRQDEILALIRIADDFGFTIGTFQHVLEGYKVADDIARHGAGGSSFSDWWMYKVEVMDAIPHNGALMTEVGVLTTFNSDSNELARRMNIEAAKGVRYGGMDPHEALRLVSYNAAAQLRVDHRMGSLEVGKDGDFVVWSADPLSVYAKCEQTWIEGAKYFDIEDDRRMRDEVLAERQRLVQKILMDAHGDPTSADDDATSQPDDAEPGSSATFAWGDELPPGVSSFFVDQIRQGYTVDMIHPGDCGCGIHGMLERMGM
ncbi:MAG: amidohydrolase family protein [Planctomycetota bacterium]